MQKLISENIFSRIKLALKNKKKNSDWARVDEPDTFLKSFEFAIYGLFITAFLMLLAWAFMINDPVHWIAQLLASTNTPAPFAERYASFGAALIFLVNLVVTIVFIMFANPDHSDIVEMISDLDSNFQERIVELDNKVSERLDEITRNA